MPRDLLIKMDEKRQGYMFILEGGSISWCSKKSDDLATIVQGLKWISFLNSLEYVGWNTLVYVGLNTLVYIWVSCSLLPCIVQFAVSYLLYNCCCLLMIYDGQFLILILLVMAILHDWYSDCTDLPVLVSKPRPRALGDSTSQATYTR